MAHATPFLLYARYPDRNKLERFLFYLNPDTRPDFPDEVPEYEQEMVPIFEFSPVPWKIKNYDSAVVAWFGDPAEEEDLSEEIEPMMQGASALGAEQVLVWWQYEDQEIFEEYHSDRRALIWDMSGLEDPDDEKKYNQRLHQDIKKQIKKMDNPEKSLLLLAETLK